MAKLKYVPLQMANCYLKYICTFTLRPVLPLGFSPQIALTGKSFRDWSPKGIDLCISLVLPFMAKCQSTYTGHGKYFLLLSPREIKLKTSTFQETGLNSRLWSKFEWTRERLCEGFLLKLLLFTWRIYPFLETEKKDRCKEEPLQEDGLNALHPKNSP